MNLPLSTYSLRGGRELHHICFITGKLKELPPPQEGRQTPCGTGSVSSFKVLRLQHHSGKIICKT